MRTNELLHHNNSGIKAGKPHNKGTIQQMRDFTAPLIARLRGKLEIFYLQQTRLSGITGRNSNEQATLTLFGGRT